MNLLTSMPVSEEAELTENSEGGEGKKTVSTTVFCFLVFYFSISLFSVLSMPCRTW